MQILLLIASFILQALPSSSDTRGIVAGQIHSSDGEPVPGISVMVVAGGFRDGRVSVVPIGISIPGTVAQTDAAGQFRLQNIPPGRYYILAKPNSNSNGDVVTFYPGVTRLVAARQVEVGPRSDIRGIDFKISKSLLVKVRGRVFDAIAGNVSRKATVNLTGGLLASFRMSVDDSGSFQFEGVPPGDYVLWATEVGSPNPPFATRRITIGERDIDGVELAFRPPVIVKGRVILEDGGRFTNPGVVPGITANIVEGTLGRGTTALMDGSFQLGGRFGLIEGEYRISVDHLPGDYYVKSMSFSLTDLLLETLKVPAPAPAEVVITLTEGTRLQGNVVDESQAPAPNTRIYLIPRDSAAKDRHLAKLIQTNQSGGFDIRGVAPGDYTLFAVTQFIVGSPEDPEFTRNYEGRGTMVTVARDVHAPLTLMVLQ
jgi:hypothetical protein